MKNKPILGILLGDSTGVGPELVAMLAANKFYDNHCRAILIGDVRVFEKGLETIGKDAPHYVINDVSEADWTREGYPVLDQRNQDPATITICQINSDCGKAAVAMIKLACQLCKDGKLEGFAFAPFNKSAMIEGGCTFESEHHLMANIFGVTGPFGEINVLGDLMTTRTTSHIPIKEVSNHLTIETITRAIKLANTTAANTGIEKPRLGICALNPHSGENGRCGREELDVIIPAIEQAVANGIDARGPFPADTLFIKAFKGEVDGVVTMYHDQGQIALKLRGFDQGVTVAGGQPYPIVTCAHGTAYDITGKGIASPSAFENAVKKAAQMASHLSVK